MNFLYAPNAFTKLKYTFSINFVKLQDPKHRYTFSIYFGITARLKRAVKCKIPAPSCCVVSASELFKCYKDSL